MEKKKFKLEKNYVDAEVTSVNIKLESHEDILNSSKFVVEKIMKKNTERNGTLFDSKGGDLFRGNCGTCKGSIFPCPGHNGVLKLSECFYNILFVKNCAKILKCICFHCSRIRLDQRGNTWKKICAITDPEKRINTLVEACSQHQICFFQTYNSSGREIKNSDIQGCQKPFYNVTVENLIDIEYVAVGSSKMEKKKQLSATECYMIFKRIRPEDLHILGFSKNNKPEDMIIKYLCIAPPFMRPSSYADPSAVRENPLTQFYDHVLKKNIILKKMIQYNQKDTDRYKRVVQDLQNVLVAMIKANAVPRSVFNKLKINGQSIVQQMDKKDGYVRNNIISKREKMMARCPISPDPNLDFDQVGVPEFIAKTLSFPEPVTHFNINHLQCLVISGPDELEGANEVYIEKEDIPQEYYKIDLRKCQNRLEIALGLKVGDIVKRHLKDDDICIMNRQPSLHRYSKNAHRIKIWSSNSLGLNPCYVGPYNADFDGDEMNFDPPQTYEGATEARILMTVKNAIVSPQSNGAIIGLIQNGILASFLITNKDTFFSREDVCQYLAFSKSFEQERGFQLPLPAILKPKQLWTGKQVYSCLFPKDLFASNNSILYKKRQKYYPIEDLNDYKVLIKDGELLRGVLDKNTIGANVGAIQEIIYRDKSPDRASLFITEANQFTKSFMKLYTHSVGIDDCFNDPKTEFLVQQKLENELLKKVDNYINSLYMNMSKNGLSEEEIEQIAMIVVSFVTDEAISWIDSEKNKYNNFRKMPDAGSRGSDRNISQILICVGQQIVQGKRSQKHLDGKRSTIYSKFYDRSAYTNGFIKNNYARGLDPYEFIMHSESTRESVVVQQSQISTVGHFTRGMCKTLDGGIFTNQQMISAAQGKIVSFTYGNGFDPTFEENQKIPFQIGNKKQWIDMYLWGKDKEKTEWMMREESRLLKDYGLIQDYAKNEKTDQFVVPLPFVRMFQIANSSFPPTDDNPLLINIKSIDDIIIDVLELQKQLYGFFTDLYETWNSTFGLHIRCHLASKRILEKYQKVLTKNGWNFILKDSYHRFAKARLNAGEMIGLSTAQFIAAPLSQMTLDTFHFVGMADKNIKSGGFSRVLELTMAKESIKMPCMVIHLNDPICRDENLVEYYAKKLTFLTINDISKYEIYYDPDIYTTIVPQDSVWQEQFQFQHKFTMHEETAEDNVHWSTLSKYHNVAVDFPEYVTIKGSKGYSKQNTILMNIFNEESFPLYENQDKAWSSMMLRFVFDVGQLKKYNITMTHILKLLHEHYGYNLFIEHCTSLEMIILRIRIPTPNSTNITSIFSMQNMQNRLIEEETCLKKLAKRICNLVVNGIKGIKKCFVKKSEGDDQIFYIETNGTNLREVLSFPGINMAKTSTNSVIETEKVLGIEAARRVLRTELTTVLNQNKSSINSKHGDLLVNTLTRNGFVVGISFNSMQKVEHMNPLVKASYEQATKTLSTAALKNSKIKIEDTTSEMIVGKKPRIGTNSIDVLVDKKIVENYAKKPETLVQTRQEAFKTRKTTQKQKEATKITTKIVDMSDIQENIQSNNPSYTNNITPLEDGTFEIFEYEPPLTTDINNNHTFVPTQNPFIMSSKDEMENDDDDDFVES